MMWKKLTPVYYEKEPKIRKLTKNLNFLFEMEDNLNLQFQCAEWLENGGKWWQEHEHRENPAKASGWKRNGGKLKILKYWEIWKTLGKENFYLG